VRFTELNVILAARIKDCTSAPSSRRTPHPTHIFAAPKGTPAPIIATLNEKVRAALTTPDAVKRWQDRGLDVIASTPDEMTAHLNREIKKWRVVFKEQGIKAE
jgi:tripartite-type tricarboxylate transporter receptor subunit TctC